MKRIVTVFAAGLLAALVPLGAAADTVTLDLAAYVARVERDNPDLSLARLKTESSGQSARMALSALLPTVAATASYQQKFEDIMAPAAAYVVNTGSPGAEPVQYVDVDQNMDNEASWGIAATFNLLAPTDIARWRQASKNREIQGDVEEITRRSIVTAAKKLYSQVQLAQAVVGLDGLAEGNSKAAYALIEKKYAAGSATELDLRLAEVDWKNDLSALDEARRNAESATLALKTLAGIPLDSDLILTEDPDSLPAFPEREAPGLASVLSARPDYRAQTLASEIADIGYKAALGAYLPTVGGSFSLMRGGRGDGAAINDFEYDAVTLQLGVTWPIFTGGYRVALVDAARNLKDQTNVQSAQKARDIERSVRTSSLALRDAMARVEAARLTAQAAERAAELAMTSLANGLITQLSYSQTATKLAGAKLNLQNAIYGYRAAFYDWQYETGAVD